MTQTRPQEVRNDDTGTEKRSPRSIRFSDQEWARLETFAVMRGMTAGELVRAAMLAAVGVDSPAVAPGRPLVPLIEQTFRYVHILATAMRGRMLEEDRAGEFDELIRSAHDLQRELQKRPTD